MSQTCPDIELDEKEVEVESIIESENEVCRVGYERLNQ